MQVSLPLRWQQTTQQHLRRSWQRTQQRLDAITIYGFGRFHTSRQNTVTTLTQYFAMTLQTSRHNIKPAFWPSWLVFTSLRWVIRRHGWLWLYLLYLLQLRRRRRIHNQNRKVRHWLILGVCLIQGFGSTSESVQIVFIFWFVWKRPSLHVFNRRVCFKRVFSTDMDVLLLVPWGFLLARLSKSFFFWPRPSWRYERFYLL